MPIAIKLQFFMLMKTNYCKNQKYSTKYSVKYNYGWKTWCNFVFVGFLVYLYLYVCLFVNQL